MMTIPSFDNLQKAVPETSITALHANFNGFCELKIELPTEINEYFKTFLAKAREHTDGTQCMIRLNPDENLNAVLVIPNRRYQITSDSPDRQEEHR